MNKKLWNEKLHLIYKVITKFYVASESNKFSTGNFEELFKLGEELTSNPEFVINLNRLEQQVYFTKKKSFSGEKFENNIMNKIFNINYSPPTEYNEILEHLVYFFALYIIPSNQYKPESYNILDFSFIKLLTVALPMTGILIRKGFKSDKRISTNKNISNQARKKENRQRIISAYDSISLSGKTRHRVALEIYDELKKADPLDLRTIKRHLKEEKLPPFN